MASWSARTSAWVIVMSALIEVSSAHASTYSGLPSTSRRMRGVPRVITKRPDLSMIPALNISATTSMIPEPQSPLALTFATLVCQSALPMTL